MTDPNAVPLTQSELDAFAEAWSETPVFRHLGIHLEYRGDITIISLPEVKDYQRGGLGTDAINGGVLSSMFDFATGCSALLVPPMRRNATVQLAIHFERAVRGNVARCEAVIDRAASNMLFVTSRMFDENGVVCSRCQGIVAMGKLIDRAAWFEGLTIGKEPSA